MTSDVIRISKLQHAYTQGNHSIPVLNGIDLSVKSGEKVAIVGRSGSGKTTLLSLLAGLEQASSGEVAIAGTDLSKLDEASAARFRSRSLSIIFQQFHLLKHFTALENVLVPLWIKEQRDEEPARKALEEVGLSHRLSHYPAELSGGERQRVAIARALVNEPLLLLADEPCGNLDEDTGEQILELLFTMVARQGTSLVLVTHDKAAAARCDRVYHLNRGILETAEGAVHDR